MEAVILLLIIRLDQYVGILLPFKKYNHGIKMIFYVVLFILFFLKNF